MIADKRRYHAREEANKNRLECQRGATAVEYALILMAVALVVVIGIGSLGTAVADLYNTIVERIFH
ncbi:MAG: Flp family type IVb pilin [Syntrophaceae bacterium]|nr:Flp family type IVb pilin [Syntrophaceae bacterium]